MSLKTSVKVPFVDLSLQHLPLKQQLEQTIQNVIQQGDFILGQAVVEFELAFAQACGVSYGVGVGTGTDAIALGLKACGIGVGDEVLLPTNTFVATLIGVLETGAKPVLVDCDYETALIDLEAAQKAITPKTKAIIPVHLYGQMVSPRQLLDFASTYNLLIFEDAAQAHLATREGYRAGAIGIAAAFSFYPSKNLGALGDGGMLVTNNLEVAQKMRSLRNYGAKQKYFHTESGINSRLDTLQAAVLNLKLPHLAAWNDARNWAGQQYDLLLHSLKEKGISPLQNQSSSGHIYHLYVTRIQTQESASAANLPDRQTIQAEFTEQGIQTGIHYPIPCHLQPAFQYLGYQAGDFPQAEKLCNQILSLPMYPGITQTQIHTVVDALQNMMCDRTSPVTLA